MTDGSAQISAARGVEAILLGDLASGDAVLATVTPIMRHLLDGGGGTIFGDAVIAGVRGMAADLARQLLDAAASFEGQIERREHAASSIAELVAALTISPALIGHLHALALEWKLAQSLQARLSLDPVLSPLVQSEMASPDAERAALAMRFLAAQARFCQDQRRMQLPLTELPGDLLHGALLALRNVPLPGGEADAQKAEALIRISYHESRTRLGLASRFVVGMADNGLSALSVSNAGSALFLTALSLASSQDRDLVSLMADESQLARLALSLRACGLKQPAVEEQFLTLHPDISLPEGFDRISADQAAALLARSAQLGGN